MSTNTFKIGDGAKSRTIFSRVERLIKLDAYFENGLPTAYLPKVVFVVVLLIAYIWNGHYAEKMIRKMDRMQVEVEDLRADFTTLKAEYMYARLQSEVAKKVDKLGLKESSQPPHKIRTTEGEY